MEIIYLITGLLLGGAFTGFFFFNKYKNSLPSSGADELKAESNQIIIEKEKLTERLKNIEDNYKIIYSELKAEREKVIQLNSGLSSSKAVNANLNQRLEEQKAELERLQERFTKEFENLANKILDEKSLKFTLQNKENMEGILKPLSEKITDFEKKVQEVYVSDSKERAGLVQQIKTLHELNQQMSKDANNLTRALKGDSRSQGAWGEFILESVLEKSGLSKGREYQIQESIKTEDGRNLRPDIIVYLPDEKNIIIDSKVSLTAYEKCISCEDEVERAIYLKDHIKSIKLHIKGLGEKNYQSLYQIGSPDFVLMFVAVEPAFALAVQNDSNLFYEAFEKNIVIVSPSTLLATLRTIANIWKQENQNRNVLEIARQSGALYDKFQGLINDLIELGKKMSGMSTHYDEAMKKLYTGRGNLISSVEKIKKLGAKTTKSLPDSLLKRIEEEDEQLLL